MNIKPVIASLAIATVGVIGVQAAAQGLGGTTSPIKSSTVELQDGLYANGVQGPAFTMSTMRVKLPAPITVDEIKGSRVFVSIRSDMGLASMTLKGRVIEDGVPTGEIYWTYVEMEDLPEPVLDAIQAQYSKNLGDLQAAVDNADETLWED